MRTRRVSAEHVKAFTRWHLHPPLMQRELFGEVPDPWQDNVLEAFPNTPRIAMQACRGPGKTHTIAVIGWNYLLTRPFPRIGATSITADNLRDGLWAEMALLQSKCELLKNMFEITRTRIFARQHPDTWWMSARTWSRTADKNTQAQTLSGIHADYTLFLLDETGGMPPAVLQEAEAAMSTGIECHIVQAGNPTQTDGALAHSVQRERHLWKVFEISGDPDDPDRATRVDIKWARDRIRAAFLGRNDPWVMANVLGKFAPGGIHQLISPELVAEATRRHYREYDYRGAPRILGVDVARHGDDASVIFPRQGIVAFEPGRYRGLDSIQGAGQVSRKWSEWDADACFVDATGGFGWGWIDQLKLLGYSPIPVTYNGVATDKARYVNKRAEMAFALKTWIEQGGAIPDIPELAQALTATTYGFKGDAYLIEPKEDLKERLGFSPDEMDSLMETFAEPVQPSRRGRPGISRHKFEWDPTQSYADSFGQPY